MKDVPINSTQNIEQLKRPFADEAASAQKDESTKAHSIHNRVVGCSVDHIMMAVQSF